MECSKYSITTTVSQSGIKWENRAGKMLIDRLGGTSMKERNYRTGSSESSSCEENRPIQVIVGVGTTEKEVYL
jgi:hypothetical protein